MNVSNNPGANIAQGQSADELMTKLSQILSNSGATSASGSEVKNEDLALRESLSIAIQEQMGNPTDPSIEDEQAAITSLTGHLSSEQSFHALMSQVMSVLIESSSKQSASRREQRSIETTQGLEKSLQAAEELRSGAQAALVTSMISAGLSLGMSVGGIGMSVKSMKNNAQAVDLKNQASKLQNPEMAGLATASSPELAAKPMDVAEAGSSSIDTLKADLLDKAFKKEQQAQKAGIAGDALGKIAGAGSSIGMAASSAQMSHATAAQAEQEALARRDQAEHDIAAEWQNRMGEVRNQILQVLQEINRANTAAQASAFRNM